MADPSLVQALRASAQRTLSFASLLVMFAWLAFLAGVSGFVVSLVHDSDGNADAAAAAGSLAAGVVVALFLGIGASFLRTYALARLVDVADREAIRSEA